MCFKLMKMWVIQEEEFINANNSIELAQNLAVQKSEIQQTRPSLPFPTLLAEHKVNIAKINIVFCSYFREFVFITNKIL